MRNNETCSACCLWEVFCQVIYFITKTRFPKGSPDRYVASWFYLESLTRQSQSAYFILWPNLSFLFQHCESLTLVIVKEKRYNLMTFIKRFDVRKSYQSRLCSTFSSRVAPFHPSSKCPDCTVLRLHLAMCWYIDVFCLVEIVSRATLPPDRKRVFLACSIITETYYAIENLVAYFN